MDYKITANFAKKLSMTGNTERHEQARNYFIACEQGLKVATEKIKESGNINNKFISDSLNKIVTLLENQESRIAKLEENQQMGSALLQPTRIKPYNPWIKKMIPKYALLESYFDINRGSLYRNILNEMENIYGIDTQQIQADFLYENNLTSCYPLEPYEYNPKYMLDILGVTPYNTNMSSFQKALKIYPNLLSDTYAKDTIREVKNSLLKKYRSGKLEVIGKYTFILPDFYAACEYWFGHINNPNGLLADKEVFCNLFRKHDKLDCLRSPHLYKEHSIRFNVASDGYGERTNRIREWFFTNGLYTSSYDLISKILQFDVDGDKSLVVADSEFVRIAERNMNGIVPLYYNMRKAEPVELNNKNIYKGLNDAFTGGNIGLYSNDISKIWNSDVFINGTNEEKQEAIDVIKLLCMENNFVIDAAKTQYTPERPEWFKPIVSKFTNKKVPAFFKYAKDKENEQVEKRNESFVNKIFDKIPNKPINTTGLKLGKIDYHLLMNNVNIICNKEVSELYDKLNKKYRYMINMKDEHIDNMQYVACQIRKMFSKTGYSEKIIADMLIEYMYGHEKRYKQLLWFCYGKYIVGSLEKNIVIKTTKFIQCIDCGEWIEVDIKDTNTERCESCYKIHRRYKIAENVRKYRDRNKM